MAYTYEDELKDVQEFMLNDFTEEFRKNMQRAQQSGALSGKESPTELVRAVLAITSDSYKPLTREGQKDLANLRHFI